MGPDPSWLDILKANSWQYACLAVFSVAALICDAYGWLPISLDANFKQGTVLAAFAFAALWLASIGTQATTLASVPFNAMKRKRALKAHAQKFRDFIPFMPREQKAVIAQLLHENHKSFTASIDGGYANPLISQGFIECSLRSGQGFSTEDVPFHVPDHIWTVACENRDAFVYTPHPYGGDAWRVDWMAR